MSRRYREGRNAQDQVTILAQGAVASILQQSSMVEQLVAGVAIGSGTTFPGSGTYVPGVANVSAESVTGFTGVTGGTPIDGILYGVGDRLLVTGLTNAANGPWQVASINAGVGVLARPSNYPTTGTVRAGTVFICGASGTQGKFSQWRVITAGLSTIGTTNVNFDMDNGNWVSANGITTIGAQTIAAGPVAVVVAAMLLTCKRTGIFRVDVDVSYSSNTTAHAVSVSLISDTSAAGVLAGTSKAAVGISGFNSSGSDHEVIATSPNSLTYNGAAFSTAPINQKVESGTGTGNATLTGLLTTNGGGTMKFSFHGVIYNAIGTTKTPFTVGNTVAVGVQFNATATDVLTFAEYNGFMSELPNL